MTPTPHQLTPPKDPELQATLERFERTMKDHWAQEAEEFKQQTLTKPQPPEQKIFSFLPHQMAKTSIFFPMSDRELKEENRRIGKIEHKTPWGQIVIEGVKLSIAEEDVFFAMMRIAKEDYVHIDDKFSLPTNINKLIHLLYGREGYSKPNREFIFRALKHFELVSFDLIVGEWKKKGRERLKIETVKSIGNIVSGFDYNEETGDLKIYFNPRFFAYFLESMLTNINFTLRRKLKKDGSKALLRFLSTHNKPDRMHILTVLNAINYNTNQPMYLLRRRFKQFLLELKKQGALGDKTRLYQDDTVYFDALLNKQSLPVPV